jgi:hypothetical protein
MPRFPRDAVQEQPFASGLTDEEAAPCSESNQLTLCRETKPRLNLEALMKLVPASHILFGTDYNRFQLAFREAAGGPQAA